MWRMLSAIVMLDAGREIRFRMRTLVIYGGAGCVVLLAVFFVLQAAQLHFGTMMSPVMASLSVAVGLLAGAGLIMLIAWYRSRQHRGGLEISKTLLATVPLAGTALQRINPQILMAAIVIVGATLLGNRLSRKD